MEIKTIVNSLVDLFFPMRCLDCQEVIQPSQFLCVSCSTNLAFTHWQFDQNNIAYSKLRNICEVENVVALLEFKHHNTTQTILHEMKYRNRPQIGIDLAQLIKFDLSDYDGIIPIPLHPKRLKKRGYNQVEYFARTLAENNQINYFSDGLIRVKYHSSQVNEDKQHRLNNLKNAFEINPNLKPGHYILIDDVLTTGATIASAVKQFNFSENFKISVITIACA
ncbi:ComF family protein [Empedobacter stercoris]|uniref:ComF family protein n=2 Tax=Empedobacter TaxID=59734 RepID=A0ABY8V558_9FLAO|nr:MULTISPECIES: ComF family protein [Empedobacter]MCA4782151.1 ComF family protein [Empedobacter stercoris]MCA4808796.1 ComF family protein [Empedobacter stercoris]MDM1522340.1 ComF family protein [Empedobacter sp. 225-1]MDM1541837.1 ComF family protein [Empedobacter sp. 189-2]NOJ75635.1 ComF family protein [Empedobacter stercoris]